MIVVRQTVILSDHKRRPTHVLLAVCCFVPSCLWQTDMRTPSFLLFNATWAMSNWMVICPFPLFIMKTNPSTEKLSLMDLLVRTYGHNFDSQDDFLRFVEQQNRSVDLILQLVRNAEADSKRTAKSPTLAAIRNASKPMRKTNKTSIPGIGLDLTVIGLFLVLGLATLVT